MAYFPDLTPCTYYDDPDPDPEDDDPPHPPVIAVGWLDGKHPFPLGDPGKEVFQRLKEVRRTRWMPHLFLGGHKCELCRYAEFYSQKDLFIPSERGITYAVPEGIVHYIGCHGYLPPQEFCEAVMKCPPPDTPEFFAALQANGWPPENTRVEPLMSDPLLQAFQTALLARGRALVAGVEAILSRSGAYPETLQLAEAVTADVEWTYMPEPDWGGYLIRAEWRVDGVLVKFDSRLDMGWMEW